MECSEMKTLRIMAASAVVLVFGHAQAQDATVAPQPSPVSQESATLSVGGVSDASRSDAGLPARTRRIRANARAFLLQTSHPQHSSALPSSLPAFGRTLLVRPTQ